MLFTDSCTDFHVAYRSYLENHSFGVDGNKSFFDECLLIFYYLVCQREVYWHPIAIRIQI